MFREVAGVNPSGFEMERWLSMYHRHGRQAVAQRFLREHRVVALAPVTVVQPAPVLIQPRPVVVVPQRQLYPPTHFSLNLRFGR